MKTLDDLKVEMPSTFELLEMLRRKIAEEEAAHFAKIAMLRERITDPNDFREMAYERDGQFYLSLKPMRAQVEAILGHIADIFALQPLPPIVLTKPDAALSTVPPGE